MGLRRKTQQQVNAQTLIEKNYNQYCTPCRTLKLFILHPIDPIKKPTQLIDNWMSSSLIQQYVMHFEVFFIKDAIY